MALNFSQIAISSFTDLSRSCFLWITFQKVLLGKICASKSRGHVSKDLRQIFQLQFCPVQEGQLCGLFRWKALYWFQVLHSLALILFPVWL